MSSFVHRRALVALLAALMLRVPARASPDPVQNVLASGELRLGNIYRDRTRELLGVTSLEDVQVLDAHVKGYQFQAVADLDTHVENTLTPDAIVDFTNRIHAEYDSPDDIQGDRYRVLDNRFQALWGLALDEETTLKTDLLVRNHYDALFPVDNATSSDLSLTLDNQLTHDSWLTFGFTGDATFFSRGESPNYFEGLGRIAYQWHDPRRVHYDTLPTPIKYPAQPEPEGASDAFRYGPELGLHESKKLFPLGRESMIGHAAPAPLIVSAEDRLFHEVQDSGADFGEVEVAVRGRDYRDAPFSNWRRLETNGSYEFNPTRGFQVDVSNQLQLQQYAVPQPTVAQTDRFSDRFRVGVTRVRKRARQTGYAAVGFHRFPGGSRFDANFYEFGATAVQAFGKRYWLYADTFYTRLTPLLAQADYPERQDIAYTLGFTVDFSECAHLTLSGREARMTVPKFDSFFDSGYYDQTLEARYHHQLFRRLAIETGVRGVRRVSAKVNDDDRHETLYFLDTVLEL